MTKHLYKLCLSSAQKIPWRGILKPMTFMNIESVNIKIYGLVTFMMLTIASSSLAQSNSLVWRLGKVDNSSAEFSNYKTVNPEVLAVPADWKTRSDWSGVSKGLKGDKNPSMEITFSLATVPSNGALMQFKLLDADKMVPEMAVFANSVMAGMLQLYGTQRTTSPYEWKKTYQLYIPKELLVAGTNVIRLDVNKQEWHGASIMPFMVWEWDYLSFETLAKPALEPIHGKLTHLGTNLTLYENGFDTNETSLLWAPVVYKWLGIAYSNNIIRANFYKNVWWNEIGDQSKRLEFLQQLKAYNMSVIGQVYGTLSVNQINDPNTPKETNPDGTLADVPKQILSDFFSQYGQYYQYHEVDNEPGLFNRSFRSNLAIANYFNEIKPAHIKTTAPGWAYWPSNGDPNGWERNPVYRRQIEQLCQATNGHSYGTSYTEDQGGSFVETLETYNGVSDGWPKEYVNTETGTEDAHLDFGEAGSTQPHASAYDRIMRGHVSVVDRTVHHAAFFGWFGLFDHPDDWSNPNGIKTHPGVDGEDSRVKTFRRLALAYATHGAPLTYEYLNKADIADKKVYFRGVNTATLAPLPGSNATANKILLNFVNFEGTAQTMKVKVTLPGCGTVAGERIGAGDIYANVVTNVSLVASPTVELTVELGPRESVQYILEMPTGGCTINGGGQAPFGSGAVDMPGIVEAENFDIGGEGISYHDVDNINTGAQHRLGEGVDIFSTSSGSNYVTTAAGEWLEYTANVTAGTYNFDFNVSSTSESQVIVIIDGVAVDTLTVPNTGGAETWQRVSLQNVVLAAGSGKVLRLETSGAVNIDNIVIGASGVDGEAPAAVTGLATSNITKTSVNLAWVASSDNVAVTEYEIYNGTNLLGVTTNTSYQVNSLSTGVEYTFTVLAKDAAGNSSAATSVTASTVEFGLPDLLVTDVEWSPKNPTPGQQVSIRIKVKNQGSARTEPGTIVGANIVLNGSQVGWSDIYADSIGVGQEVVLIANNGPNGPTFTAGAAGTDTVAIYLDDLNRVLEVDDNNNYFEKPLIVSAPVSTDSIKLVTPINRAVYEEGDTIKFKAIVVGAGASKVIFARNALVIGEDSSEPYELELTNLPKGVHGITAITILAGDTIESSASVVIVNKPLPDLIVTDITYTPANPKAKSPIVFTAHIKNIGKVATPEGTILGMSFWSNGHQTYADTYTKSLAAGDSVMITATSGAGGKNYWVPDAPGYYTVEMQVDDYNNRIPERNENNNFFKKSFCVLDSLGNPWTAIKLSTTTGTKLAVGSNVVLATELSSCGMTTGISKVEFYQGATKIGEDVTAPYAFVTQTNSTTSTYKFSAKLVDMNGLASVSDTITVYTIDPCVNLDSAILRETWYGINGVQVTDLTSSPNYPYNPSTSVNITDYFEFGGGGDNVGNKLSGILTAPTTGEYTFYTASDDYSELWLSTDADPASKVKIASLEGYANWQEWNKYPSQKSGVINLVAGNKYYIEALQQNGSGGNSLNVGWILPGETNINVIPATVMTVYVADRITIVTPMNSSIVATDSLMIAANVSGCQTITQVEFYAGSTKIGEDAETPYQLLWKNIMGGNYMLTARAITAVDTLVSDTTNVTVIGNADLVVSQINWTPVDPSTDDAVSFTATVTNQGSARADSIDVAFYVNGTLVNVSNITIDGLNVGQTIVVSAVTTWETNIAGNYDVTVVVDNSNSIIESDETNNSMTSTLIVTKGQLRIPENPANVANGVDYHYYHGIWFELPDFTDRVPVKSGAITNFSLAPRKRNIFYAFQFEGYVNVPANGQYTFFTTSDDGSKLYIGDQLVVNNNGLHTNRERSGTIGLKAGKHAVRVTFFQLFGGATLQVAYQGPGITRQPIPAENLFRSTVESSIARVANVEEMEVVEETNTEMQIYPNPATDDFTVKYYSPSNQKVRIRIVDLTSRIVEDRIVDAIEGFNKEQFNRNGMQAGMYLIQMNAPTLREVKKLQLQ